ncbi:MAG: ABC transporter ATP-binding protein [Rhizobiales bacterium 24-66-13]|jgi:branched-chain amino acid transport system ATP-binding protein|nr:MAG: ABC transporter ATP-binding protein [Rhizobiales bacterium 12-66-7]OYZ75471.1 MAG: ABC transporter ATP-binding protein [Rhizobiales bacterium 24-66-13]OZB10732.1 MAG: ABC transporter ATP-binding protein [Rhizobiales bacterium 39-66-18]HQS45234.1 ABC transporter ATP-binding protein [Xanthobacteraceae bacterium]
MGIAIEARDLSKQFNGFFAVKDVSLQVAENTIHGIIGPNGAGKTTLFNLLTSFLKPTHGSIHYRGRNITHLEPAAVSRLGLVRSFQISSVFDQLSARDNVRVALQGKEGGSYCFWRSTAALARFDDRADELLEMVGLTAYADTASGSLAYGRKRALELATTLALEPETLLLDEPMSGLGPEDIGPITELIRTVAKGRTVVMVEHNLPVVATLSDTITVLARGQLLASGTYAEVTANPEVITAYLGEDDDDE